MLYALVIDGHWVLTEILWVIIGVAAFHIITFQRLSVAGSAPGRGAVGGVVALFALGGVAPRLRGGPEKRRADRGNGGTRCKGNLLTGLEAASATV